MTIDLDKSIPKRITFTNEWVNVIAEKDYKEVPFTKKIVLTDEEIEYLYNRINK